MRKKTICIGLALLMLVSLTGCGNGSTPATSSAAASGSAVIGSSTSGTSAADTAAGSGEQQEEPEPALEPEETNVFMAAEENVHSTDGGGESITISIQKAAAQAATQEEYKRFIEERLEPAEAADTELYGLLFEDGTGVTYFGCDWINAVYGLVADDGSSLEPYGVILMNEDNTQYFEPYEEEEPDTEAGTEDGSAPDGTTNGNNTFSPEETALLIETMGQADGAELSIRYDEDTNTIVAVLDGDFYLEEFLENRDAGTLADFYADGSMGELHDLFIEYDESLRDAVGMLCNTDVNFSMTYTDTAETGDAAVLYNAVNGEVVSDIYAENMPA